MKIVNMKKHNNGTLKGFFDLETSEGITIKGFKIVDSKNGLFVAVPSEQDRTDKTKFWDKVKMTKEVKETLTDMALKEYEQS